MKEKVLFIDSSQRPNLSEQSTNFNITLSPEIKRVKQVILQSIYLPLTWYNISQVYDNNTIIINVGTSNVSLTLTNGMYQTIQDLVNEIQTLIQTQRSTLTATISKYSGLVVIQDTATTPTDFSLVFTGALGMIGFTSGQTLSGEYSYTSLNVPSLIYNSYFMLKLGFLTSQTKLINNDQLNVSYIIPYGDLSQYNIGQLIELTSIASDNWLIDLDSCIDLNQFNIQLFDQYQNIINLNGTDWICKIKLICDE